MARRLAALLLCPLAVAGADPLALTRDPPRAYRSMCARLAAYAPPAARVCPPLVPAGPMKLEFAGPFSRERRYRGGFVADLSSHAIDTLAGRPIATNGGHWHFDVSWTPAVRRLAVGRAIEQRGRCRRVRVAGARVEACRVIPYSQGGGLHGGHIAYVWTRGRTTYVVSLHGYANEPRAAAMMAAWIARVRETCARGCATDGRGRSRAGRRVEA